MTQTQRAATVTGLGAVSPVGVGTPAFVRGLREARLGVGLIRDPDPRMQSTVAARCDGFDPASVLGTADLKRFPRMIPMALAAAGEAMASAGLSAWIADGGESHAVERSRRVGVLLGTGAGGIDFTLDQAITVHAHDGQPSLWTITNATHGNLAGELSIRLGLRGPSHCVSDGCASSSDALGLALQLLRADAPWLPDAWVVVGADAHIRWETLRGMELLKVISTRNYAGDPEAARSASRPFDARRDGFVLGEGAWAAVVERPAFAREREAPLIGSVLGYAATCDAYHRVRPDPSMTECVRAIRGAIADAGLTEDDLGLVQYHGTATRVNDEQETAAVRLAFGDQHARRLIGSSIKASIGHPQGACGLASVVAMLGAMRGLDGREPFCPPTATLEEPDPACDLDYCARSPRAIDTDDPRMRRALVNCLAFGAKNAAIVVGL